MNLTSRQIRAARALLGWHQKDLAYVAGISELSVINFENEKTKAQDDTIDRIKTAFELNNIGFTETGVEEKESTYTTIVGEEWYIKLLDDMEKTLDSYSNSLDKEVIFIYPDERLSPPSVIEKFQKFLNKGIIIKEFIKETNTFIPTPLEYNRYIPRDLFDDNNLVMCYGDKVAIYEQQRNTRYNNEEGYIVERIRPHAEVNIYKNQHLAELIKFYTNIMWDTLPQPTTSTASYFYE